MNKKVAYDLKEHVIRILMAEGITVHGYTQYNNIDKNRVEGLIEYSFSVGFTNAAGGISSMVERDVANV